MNEQEPKIYREGEYLEGDGYTVAEDAPTHYRLTLQLKEPEDERWDSDGCMEADWNGECYPEAYDYQGEEQAYRTAYHCAKKVAAIFPRLDIRVAYDVYTVEDEWLSAGYVVVKANGEEYRRAAIDGEDNEADHVEGRLPIIA